MILHLIRHGKTRANEEKLYCGQTDLPLNEAGIKELIALKEKVAYPTAPLYIVSGLIRTVETAKILFDDPPLTTVPGLQEINFGVFEMRHYEELKSDPAYQHWINDLDHAYPPDGESKSEFTERVLKGLIQVEQLGQLKQIREMVVVTHGGVIQAAMNHYFPGKKSFYEWQPACGQGYSIDLSTKRYERI